MRANKLIWAECTSALVPVRIVHGNPTGIGRFMQIRYGEAVAAIRKQLWLRCAGACELCTSPVTEASGQMHEMKHRGRGGEISLTNSVFACAECHKYQHRDRNPKFTRRFDKVK